MRPVFSTFFQKILQAGVQVYRFGISPYVVPRCRFYPTCSAYALEALETHGPWQGGWLAAQRFARCHPWGGDGLDPVPKI